ncbi:MAG: GNAT family N-acetyltransferase [Halioglobus sp.]
MTIEFKLTQDPHLLQEYYALREQCFRNELGLSDFDGSEDEQDRQGQILLAIQDGRCIAGARISPTVQLQSQINQLELKPNTCCMWERFVFDPAVRSVTLIREYVSYLIEVSREAGYQHAMILSSLRNARFYRQCHTALGVGYQIHRHVPHCAQGTFAGLEHYLSVSYLLEAEPLMAATDQPISLRSSVYR